MKKVKFRLWDVKNNQYIEKFLISQDGKKIYLLDDKGDFYYTDDINEKTSNYILEQFTGYKDKYGVEIYDGDVVEVDNGNVGVVFWSYDVAKHRVSFGKEKSDLTNYWYNQLKVVGNVRDGDDYSECLEEEEDYYD